MLRLDDEGFSIVNTIREAAQDKRATFVAAVIVETKIERATRAQTARRLALVDQRIKTD